MQSRRGKDASYIVSQDYKAYATMKAVDSDKGEEFPIWVTRCLLTDLASIPWFRRPFVDRVGPHLEAGIIHDWLYVAWQVEEREPMETMRTFVDDVLHVAMKKTGVNSFKLWVIYKDVRSLGKDGS